MANISPVKRKDGTIYAYRIRVFRGKDLKGKPLKPWDTTWRVPEGMKNPKTIKKELDKYAALFEKECKCGITPTEKKTFQEYAESVMLVKERDRKNRTVERYREMLVDRIYPEIGFLKLTDITAEHLNRFYVKLAQPGQNKKTGGGLSEKTIVEHHKVIHALIFSSHPQV